MGLARSLRGADPGRSELERPRWKPGAAADLALGKPALSKGGWLWWDCERGPCGTDIRHRVGMSGPVAGGGPKGREMRPLRRNAFPRLQEKSCG